MRIQSDGLWSEKKQGSAKSIHTSYPNHEKHSTMQCWEGPPPQGLSEARRGSAVFCKYTYRHRSAAGAPRRGQRGSSQIIWNYKHSITHISLVQFNMEMSPVFPFCVPVAAGIVFVFMGNPHNISQRSFWVTARNASAPAAVALSLER